MLVVLTTLTQVNPPSVEYSHLSTLPVSPANVNVVGPFEPLHTVALLVTVPPTLTRSTLITAMEEVSMAHTAPLRTSAIYQVVVDRLV